MSTNPFEQRLPVIVQCFGGIGDQIAGEPVVRYLARKLSSDRPFTIRTHYPFVFRHLSEEGIEIAGYPGDVPFLDPDRLVYNVYAPGNHPKHLVIDHSLVQSTDFMALFALRGTLPRDLRRIMLPVTLEERKSVMEKLDASGGAELSTGNMIAVHAGKSWPTRTFPISWWNDVLNRLVCEGRTPVLIGEKIAGRGFLEVDPLHCLDLRGKLAFHETIALLDIVSDLLTNDSAPVHMAGATDVRLHTLCTVRRPEIVWPYRGLDSYGRMGDRSLQPLSPSWRAWDYAKGGVFQKRERYELELAGGRDFGPQGGEIFQSVEASPEEIMSWLPDPRELAKMIVLREGD